MAVTHGSVTRAAPTEVPRKVEVRLDTGLRRDVGRTSLLFTGVGAIIGSGWLFGALYASQIAGPAAILSWVIGGVMVMAIGVVYAELAVMFPVAGGIIRFPRYYVLVWWKLAMIALVVVAFFALAFNLGNLGALAGFAPRRTTSASCRSTSRGRALSGRLRKSVGG